MNENKQEMSQIDVQNLMASSHSEEEWNANCDKVKAAFGGDYPSFWYFAIILSGILTDARKEFDW